MSHPQGSTYRSQFGVQTTGTTSEFKDSSIDRSFLYWVLRTQEYQGYVLGAATGTSVRHTAPATVLQHEFLLPCSSDEQGAIATVLDGLDDKIDLLHRQNQTLEAMAETLFRQWFVEQVEDDWAEFSVNQFADHLKTSVNPASEPETCYLHFSLPAFDKGKRPEREIGSQILSNKFKVEPWVVLVSKLNPRVPRIWSVAQIESGGQAVCSTEFQVLRPKSRGLFSYLYCLLASRDARDALTMAASGTSGSHQRVRPEDILNIKTSLPSIELAEEFSKLVVPLLKKQFANIDQVHALEKLRDTLLPKLMSGEVRVAC